MADEKLRIIGVDLQRESMKTQRVLNGGHQTDYPVAVGLSRPVDEFETIELKSFLLIDDDDEMHALFPSTTLEKLEANLGDIHAKMDLAVARARQVREDATAEDARLRELATTLSRKLKEKS